MRRQLDRLNSCNRQLLKPHPPANDEEMQMKVSATDKGEKPVAADVQAITLALAEPFDPSAVRFKPAVVSGNRAMALAYVDARVIQDRLDAVLGVDGWQDDYECRDDGSVVCRLRLRLGDEWVT